ncbi:hypothetical protein ABZ714_12925 [Streptomyces sp. NPDC006798]|uniref:hypothetical protein n=1 Tax=Streptomyces sp. NPDC006798 TaxID=3155462 RepID=UPI00340FF826
MPPKRYIQRDLPVPYITRWERETVIHPEVVVAHGPQGPHLGFADESFYDRDSFGVLWVRQAIQRGRGRARFEEVHALRQRRAMLDLLCQICGIPMFEADRQLYVVTDAGGTPIREGELTTSPPVCRTCAPDAIRYCPRLRAGHAAAWVRQSSGWGVEAFLYHPKTLRRISPEPRRIPYEDPRAQWAVAFRSVVILRGCTPVNIADLASQS